MVNEAATGIQGNRSRVADDRQSEIRLALRPFPSRYRRTFMDIEEPHGLGVPVYRQVVFPLLDPPIRPWPV